MERSEKECTQEQPPWRGWGGKGCPGNLSPMRTKKLQTGFHFQVSSKYVVPGYKSRRESRKIRKHFAYNEEIV